MAKKISDVQKNRLLLPVTGAVILLCWFLAFSKTFEAIQMNRQLSGQIANDDDISFNPAYTERKLAALNRILKSYQINEAEWSNHLWMKASAIAMKQGVGIDYSLTKPVTEPDTTALGLKETLYCYGNYLQLVKLVDTLERIPAIGKISALQIKAPKEDVVGERANQCILKLQFTGFN